MPEHDASTAARRKAILDALLELSSARGLHDTPISVIAKRAGISQGLVYHYFGSKQDLVHELYREVKVALLRATLGDVDASDPPKRRFAGFVANSVRYGVAHPREMSFLAQFEALPEYNADWQQEFGDLLRPMFELMQEGLDTGLLKPLPIELLSAMAGGAMLAASKAFMAQGKMPDDMTLYLLTEVCWDAICSHPG